MSERAIPGTHDDASDASRPRLGRVVFLAYYFPPLAGIASERAFSLSRHLKAIGWDVEVITPRDGFYHRVAEEGAFEVPVIRTGGFELSRVLRRAYGGYGVETNGPAVMPVDAGSMGRWARRIARDYLYVPDAQFGWIPAAAFAATRSLQHGTGPRVVFSTSVPYSAHFAAMLAARRSGAGWVAEFRDPWSTGTSPNRSSNPSRRKLDAWLEDRIVQSAGHVICTTRSTRQGLLEAHKHLTPERISVITNGFEPIPEARPPSANEPMTILYAGTVAAGEDPVPVLSTLAIFANRHPGAFRFRVLGPSAPWSSPEQDQRRPWLELEGVVSATKAREAMAESSALLLFHSHPAHSQIIPGKAFEYIGVRRPILAICQPDTEMLEVMARHADVRHVKPDALDDLVQALERLLDEHRSGHLQHPRVPIDVTSSLRRSDQAVRLSAILERAAR
jgi:hypothetical protein